MSLNVKEFEEAINESHLLIGEGKLVIIDRWGKRQEHHVDGEVRIDSGFFTTLKWTENDEKKEANVPDIKSVNGIQKSKFE